ncbi:poly-beta-1,6 N-acetyl-D-glucosamine export porin PgaA [Pseudorhodoferax aquiterrae]|nr:poly-beta-1,6 N-acetyl-D-glucosamine export porin PgaA [Pseudorhodoferax aquiterrae]GHC74495.1 poly-beta-1,6 N-acetyl-D-glucosamine export porin PgaA [Pseudorhodoferax aquiterrae]
MNRAPVQSHARSRLQACVAALLLASCTSPSWAVDRYGQAISQARAGQYDSALATLQDLLAQNPRRLDVRHDLIAVQSWAERHEEALASSRTLRLGANTPDYVLAAIGKSALSRNEGARAAQAYGLLAQRRPRSADAALGAGLALLADGKPAQADAQLRRTLVLARQDVPMLQSAFAALQARGEGQRARPFGERLLALGAQPPVAAAPAPTATPPVPAPIAAAPVVAPAPTPTLADAQATNGRHIREAIEVLDRDFTSARYAPIEAAIAENARLIEQARTQGAADVLLRLRRDRIVALRQRGQAEDALVLFRELEAEGPQPSYVVLAAADAQLQLRQPTEARALYRRVLLQEPTNAAARSGLIFAEVEAENFPAAEAVSQDQLRDSGASVSARRTDIMLMRFADRLNEAEAALNTLQAELPDDAGLWLDQGELLARRGLPRAAAERFQAVLSRSPDNIRARVGLAEAIWAQGDIAQARTAIEDLQRSAPEHPAVQRLVRAWERSKRPLLVSGATRGLGQGHVAGNNDLIWESTLYSGMFGDGQRVYANHHLARASFDDNSAKHERAGMGIEITRRDWQASMEVGQDLRNGNDAYWAVGGSRQFGDHFSVRARHESQTNDFPLKGRMPDAENYLNAPRYLHASKSLVGAAYQWNESRRIAADLAYYDFNDGNRRKSFAASWTERLYSGYGKTLDLQPAFYASANTLRDAIYFNPARDMALSVTLAGDWLTWRRYDKSFNQRAAITIGSYKQFSDVHAPGGGWMREDYGWNFFHDLRYEHEWNIGPDFSTRYGVGTRRFPYDGVYETKGYIYLHATWRF